MIYFGMKIDKIKEIIWWMLFYFDMIISGIVYFICKVLEFFKYFCGLEYLYL